VFHSTGEPGPWLGPSSRVCRSSPWLPETQYAGAADVLHTPQLVSVVERRLLNGSVPFISLSLFVAWFEPGNEGPYLVMALAERQLAVEVVECDVAKRQNFFFSSVVLGASSGAWTILPLVGD
jgi:hypothetical protein